MLSSASATDFCVVFLVINLHSPSFTQEKFTESARFRTGSMDLTPLGLHYRRYRAHHDVPTGPKSARIRPRFALLNFFARQVPLKISRFLPRRCPAPLRPASPAPGLDDLADGISGSWATAGVRHLARVDGPARSPEGHRPPGRGEHDDGANSVHVTSTHPPQRPLLAFYSFRLLTRPGSSAALAASCRPRHSSTTARGC